MLEYAGKRRRLGQAAPAEPDQGADAGAARLARRSSLRPTAAFEEVAGDLLRELGYGAEAAARPGAGARRLARYSGAGQRLERFEPCFAAFARLAAAAPAAV